MTQGIWAGGVRPLVHCDLRRKYHSPRLECKASFSSFPFLRHIHWSVTKWHRLRAGNSRTWLPAALGARGSGTWWRRAACFCRVVRGACPSLSPLRHPAGWHPRRLCRHPPRLRPNLPSSCGVRPALTTSPQRPCLQRRSHPEGWEPGLQYTNSQGTQGNTRHGVIRAHESMGSRSTSKPGARPVVRTLQKWIPTPGSGCFLDPCCQCLPITRGHQRVLLWGHGWLMPLPTAWTRRHTLGLFPRGPLHTGS